MISDQKETRDQQPTSLVSDQQGTREPTADITVGLIERGQDVNNS